MRGTYERCKPKQDFDDTRLTDFNQVKDMMSMYVASNYERLNGAAVLLYPNLLRDFAERIAADFNILPSSIHELIFLSESAGIGSESLKMRSRKSMLHKLMLMKSYRTMCILQQGIRPCGDDVI